MTLHDLYFNQFLVNDNTILRIIISDGVTVNGHWYEDGINVAIYRNKDRKVRSFGWVDRYDGSELIVQLDEDYI